MEGGREGLMDGGVLNPKPYTLKSSSYEGNALAPVP